MSDEDVKNDIMDYNEIFRDRTKRFAIAIVKQMSKLKYSDEVSVIRKQLFRSVTSVAANYRAVKRARSNKERYAKICIVLEEADETLFWLEIIQELNILPRSAIIDLLVEAEEILKIMATYKKKLSLNH